MWASAVPAGALMKLWLERSERPGFLSGRIYVLRMQIICSAVEYDLIERHDIGGDAVWLSPDALGLAAAAEEQFEKASECGLLSWQGTKQSLALNMRGLKLARASDREAQISVGDLVDGTALEACSVGELMEAEAGIRIGFQALAKRIAVLADYELGDEELIESDDGKDEGTPPAGWVRLGGGRR